MIALLIFVLYVTVSLEVGGPCAELSCEFLCKFETVIVFEFDTGSETATCVSGSSGKSHCHGGIVLEIGPDRLGSACRAPNDKAEVDPLCSLSVTSWTLVFDACKDESTFGDSAPPCICGWAALYAGTHTGGGCPAYVVMWVGKAWTDCTDVSHRCNWPINVKCATEL